MHQPRGWWPPFGEKVSGNVVGGVDRLVQAEFQIGSTGRGSSLA
ncbi:MAG: hypothetical protein QXM80_02070 [Thermofilaceae archaeon]